MEGYHESVLLREVIENLKVEKDKWYLDCTLGDGGHSVEILKLGGKVIGLDVDPQALERAKKRLGNLGYLGKIRFVQGNFRDIKNLLQQADLADQKFAGAIFDLGVSSLQLESPERGFSFRNLGSLDMRMDPTLQIKALDLVNNLSGKELYEIFKNLGEEKYSKRLADTLVLARAISVFTTTLQLAQVIERAVGRRETIPARHASRSEAGRHPATRVFQALRIVVNDELDALREGLDQVKDIIYGHILVISFHSLEDRIVKFAFRDWEKRNLGQIVTKKPILPTEKEISRNPRARSAKLRIFKINDNYKEIRANRE